MSSTGPVSSSLDIDSSRNYIYTSNCREIRRYRFSSADNDEERVTLPFVDNIPVVRTWDNTVVKPDNLLLYKGGERMLMIDAEKQDSILNMNIERGIVTNRQSVHTSFGSQLRSSKDSEDVIHKVKRFDYNNHGTLAQYERCAIGVNSNQIMRFDLESGQLIDSKSYERSPGFSAIVTDISGNVIVGDSEGKIRLYADIGKKAVKCSDTFSVLPITHLDVSSKGDLLATTDKCFFYLPYFIKIGSSDQTCSAGNISSEICDYLDLHDMKVRTVQFSVDNKTIIFSIGKYLFHWSIQKLINDEHEYAIYEADNLIMYHKGQYVLTTKPIKFT